MANGALIGVNPDGSATATMSQASHLIIDVNGSESYKEGHVPGAIDFEAVGGKLAKALPQDKNALIIAYCGGPQCRAYQAAAKAAGYRAIPAPPTYLTAVTNDDPDKGGLLRLLKRLP